MTCPFYFSKRKAIDVNLLWFIIGSLRHRFISVLISVLVYELQSTSALHALPLIREIEYNRPISIRTYMYKRTKNLFREGEGPHAVLRKTSWGSPDGLRVNHKIHTLFPYQNDVIKRSDETGEYLCWGTVMNYLSKPSVEVIFGKFSAANKLSWVCSLACSMSHYLVTVSWAVTCIANFTRQPL